MTAQILPISLAQGEPRRTAPARAVALERRLPAQIIAFRPPAPRLSALDASLLRLADTMISLAEPGSAKQQHFVTLRAALAVDAAGRGARLFGRRAGA